MRLIADRNFERICITMKKSIMKLRLEVYEPTYHTTLFWILMQQQQQHKAQQYFICNLLGMLCRQGLMNIHWMGRVGKLMADAQGVYQERYFFQYMNNCSRQKHPPYVKHLADPSDSSYNWSKVKSVGCLGGFPKLLCGCFKRSELESGII